MQFLNSRAIAAYALVFGLVVLMTGCGGGGQSSADKKAAVTVTQVEIIPSPSVSLAPGEVVQMSAAALNANGSQVFTQTISFSSSNSAIQITQNGLLCAGTWDSLTTPVVCTPVAGVTATTVITSNVTASAGGVTSPTVVISIHLPITSVTITPTAPACVAEAGTQVFNAHAFNGGADITPSVGTFNWTSQTSSVATIPATGDTGHTDQATATAVHPGQTNITASIGNVTPVTSAPAVFTQCLVANITVMVPAANPVVANDSSSHFEIATAANRTLTVTVTDTLNHALTTLPSLNWTTSNPAVATVSGTSTGATVNGGSPGSVGISASCLPNNCNIGTNSPVTSNLVTGTITGTAPTSATAYVTCTDPTVATGHTCTTQPSTTSTATQTQLFPINGTTVGTAINLPHTPTSMMINRQNSHIYLGSTAGLMVVDAGANSFTSTVINAPGDVLTVAPNGNAVVITSGNDVFLYNGSTVTTLLKGAKHIVGATAAAFSPDSGTLLVTTSTGELWFEVAGLTPTLSGTSLSSPSDISFLPSGTFAIAATTGGLVSVEACDQAVGAASPSGSFDHVIGVPTTDGSHNAVDSVVATASPNIHRVDYGIAGSGTPAGCPYTLTATDNSVATAGFTANQLVLSPDSTHAFVIGGAKVIDYDIANNAATSVALSGSPNAKSGGVAANGAVYVGGGADNKVHVITADVEGTPITTTIPADLVVAKSH